MRRSFREAIIGFSILGGVAAFAGSMLWLRGVRIGSNSWEVTANFRNASGLAEQSPVTYRGIFIGSVKKITFTPQAIQAKLSIDSKNIALPKPVIAKVVKSSILGGDVQVALISLGEPLLEKENNLLSPTSKDCQIEKILCEGDVIRGETLMSISTLTEKLEQILQKADKEEIVTSLGQSIKQFNDTQQNLDNLILLSREEIKRVGPIMEELTKASKHLNNILASIDNPKTLNDIKETASSTRSISKKVDSLTTNVDEMVNDEELMKALRNITIGLGKLFNEIYP